MRDRQEGAWADEQTDTVLQGAQGQEGVTRTCSVADTKKCCCLRRSSLPSYVRSSG